ncbi:hypothetical protein FA13DRAFT_780747 [Coprinellus micaceus]|uniref:Uncharacterized protein n=1 Tax=Coprinellus micaceus TaxID=71717 RepID=A0A4Y7S703_COPMI|nr:hypothetical protein FA13DRAFT_780747 [Coprinellus micaceus]
MPLARCCYPLPVYNTGPRQVSQCHACEAGVESILRREGSRIPSQDSCLRSPRRVWYLFVSATSSTFVACVVTLLSLRICTTLTQVSPGGGVGSVHRQRHDALDMTLEILNSLFRELVSCSTSIRGVDTSSSL